MLDTAKLQSLTEDAKQIGDAIGILKAKPALIQVGRHRDSLTYRTEPLDNPCVLPFSEKLPSVSDMIRAQLAQIYETEMTRIASEIRKLCNSHEIE